MERSIFSYVPADSDRWPGTSVKLPYARIMAALQRHDGSLEDVREPSLVEYDCHEG